LWPLLLVDWLGGIGMDITGLSILGHAMSVVSVAEPTSACQSGRRFPTVNTIASTIIYEGVDVSVGVS